MVASLVLLAAFLGLFLKMTYDGERDALAKEAGYLFIGAVREIEGDALEKLVKRRAFLPDSMPTAPPVLPMGNDSVAVVAFFDDRCVAARDTHRRVEIRVDRHGPKKGPAEMSGSLAMVVKMDGKADSTSIVLKKEGFLPQLTANFDSALGSAGLTVAHWVARSGDTLEIRSNLTAGSYTDLASGERFTAQVGDYQWFLLKKMWASILFSLVVFGLVTAAFWSISRSLAAQKKLLALKNDLLQNISHELKTPVATVSVALEALGGFDAMADPGRTREYLDISRSELNRLSLLVDKVLGVAQFERGAVPVRMAAFDFKKMVEEVLAAMRLQIEKSGATVDFQTFGDGFESVGDSLHLSGVVFNLLDNALKYSGLLPKILIKLTQTSLGSLLLEVADNGPGVPPEFRERVFEKFFRVPTGARHDVKGHGLGLAYAAEVVRLHGGQIWAEGSSFFVEING